jgi:hypothetical protein
MRPGRSTPGGRAGAGTQKERVRRAAPAASDMPAPCSPVGGRYA